MKTKRRPPMLTSEWRVITNVLNIRSKLFPPRLRSLTILMSLKARNTVVAPFNEIVVYFEIKMLAIDPRTIIKSKLFQPSEK